MTASSAENAVPFSRVLVTGGQGFVGRRLVARLRSLGVEIHVGAVSGVALDAPYCGVVPFDLEDAASVDEAVARVRPDLVVHLAAQSSVGQAAGDEATTWAVNVDGSGRLAEAVIRHSPEALFLFPSSAEVYGAAFLDGMATEETKPKPVSVYARSKLAAEEVLKSTLSRSRLIITRPANHSGAGQDVRFVLPSFAAQIRSGAQQIRVGNLSAERDFLHVDDVIDAMLSLVMASHRLPSHATFNIASGRTWRIAVLLDKLIEMAGGDIKIVVDPDRLRPAEIPVAALSTALIGEATGWRPSRSVEQILRELLEAP